MALDIPKSEAYKSANSAAIAEIAAKYGDKSAAPAQTQVAATGVSEPSVFEMAVAAEAKAAAAAAPVVVEEPKVEPEVKAEVPKATVISGDTAGLVARMAAMDAEMAELKKQRRQEQAVETKKVPKAAPVAITAAMWKADPLGCIAKLGGTEEDVAQHLVYKTLGGKVDGAIAANVITSRQEGVRMSENAELRAEIAALRSDIRQERYNASLDKTVPEAEKYPHLAEARTKNASALSERLRNAAKAAAATMDPDDDAPTPESVMALVEKELADTAALFGYDIKAAKSKEKTADTQDTKTDVAPALTANTMASSYANRAPGKTWKEMDAEIRKTVAATHRD